MVRDVLAQAARVLPLVPDGLHLAPRPRRAVLRGRPQVVRLLGALAAVEGMEWLRLMYTYPAFWTDEMIDALITLKWGHPVTDAASAGRLKEQPALISNKVLASISGLSAGSIHRLNSQRLAD